MASQISVNIFLLSLLFPFLAFAQRAESLKPLPPQKAETLSAENAVYESASFDAKVIAVLPAGKVFSISNNLFSGAFYRIRVRDGVIGYIADSDVKPLGKKASAKKSSSLGAKATKDKGQDSQPKKNPRFEFARYVGASYYLNRYEEDTMGSSRSEQMGFFGIKMSGANVLLEGLVPTELNILYAPRAPDYYQKVTGQASSGWIFIMDFLLQTYIPQSKDSMLLFGFGPMFRFSKFDVGLRDSGTGTVTQYSMQDMALGAAFNAGIALRVSNIALRLEAKYHWEKRSYLGFGTALQFPF